VALRLRAGPGAAAPTVALCAIYWHFLLIVWVAMLAILTGWAADAAALCRAILI
jgi:cytochrome c oxidase subunit 3